MFQLINYLPATRYDLWGGIELLQSTSDLSRLSCLTLWLPADHWLVFRWERIIIHFLSRTINFAGARPSSVLHSAVGFTRLQNGSYGFPRLKLRRSKFLQNGCRIGTRKNGT